MWFALVIVVVLFAVECSVGSADCFAVDIVEVVDGSLLAHSELLLVGLEE